MYETLRSFNACGWLTIEYVRGIVHFVFMHSGAILLNHELIRNIYFNAAN